MKEERRGQEEVCVFPLTHTHTHTPQTCGSESSAMEYNIKDNCDF